MTKKTTTTTPTKKTTPAPAKKVEAPKGPNQEELRAQLSAHDDDIAQIQAEAAGRVAEVQKKKALLAAQLLSLALGEELQGRIARLREEEYPKEEDEEAFTDDPRMPRWTTEVETQQQAIEMYQTAIEGGATRIDAVHQTVQSYRDLGVAFHARLMQLASRD